ncbi:hypothetical protein HXA35_01725 [Bacillus sp. A301a_S52]|nr:hypothetical protein [Bacillus sp. A301a_S52]
MSFLKKRYNLLLIASLLIISITIVTVVNTQWDQREEETGIDLYDNILALDFYLNVAYYREGSSFHIAYSPSSLTEDLLERWQAITEVYPFLSYPEEAIARNDWREVIAAYDGIRAQYGNKMREDDPSFGIITSYIETGSYIRMDDDLKDKLGLD